MADLIDRREAIKAIGCGHLSAATIYGRSDEGMMVLAESIRAINSLPSERKKGKWLIAEGACEPDYMECSNCKWITEYYNGLEEEWNYCPHCGADMRENR